MYISLMVPWLLGSISSAAMCILVDPGQDVSQGMFNSVNVMWTANDKGGTDTCSEFDHIDLYGREWTRAFWQGCAYYIAIRGNEPQQSFLEYCAASRIDKVALPTKGVFLDNGYEELDTEWPVNSINFVWAKASKRNGRFFHYNEPNEFKVSCGEYWTYLEFPCVRSTPRLSVDEWHAVARILLFNKCQVAFGKERYYMMLENLPVEDSLPHFTHLEDQFEAILYPGAYADTENSVDFNNFGGMLGVRRTQMIHKAPISARLEAYVVPSSQIVALKTSTLDGDCTPLDDREFEDIDTFCIWLFSGELPIIIETELFCW